MDLELSQSLDTDIWCYNARWQRSMCTLTWPVPKFSECVLRTGEFLTSPFFKYDENSVCSWYLRMYPYGTTELNSHYICMSLHCISQFDTSARYFWAIRDRLGNLEQLYLLASMFPSSSSVESASSFVDRSFLMRNRQLLPDDTLNIFCFVAEKTAIGDRNTTLWERGHFHEESYYSSISRIILAEDLVSILESGAFHDVVLGVESQDYLAHRNILTARSSVFAGLLQSDPEQKRFCISNIDGKTLQYMLRYIYSNEHGYLTEETASNLLGAAKMYGLEHLRRTCSSFLVSVINKSNSLKLLRLGHLLNDQDLKMASLRFVTTYQKAAFDGATWRMLLASDPELARDVQICLTSAKVLSIPDVGVPPTTVVEPRARSLTWAIEEFRHHCNQSAQPVFTSPNFTLSPCLDFMWRIELVVSRFIDHRQCLLSIQLIKDTIKDFDGTVSYRCSIVDGSKRLQQLVTGFANNVINNVIDNVGNAVLDVSDDNLIPCGTLTLHFHIEVRYDIGSVMLRQGIKKSLSDDMKILLSMRNSTGDVVLFNDQFETKAHSYILASRSSVWADLLRNYSNVDRVLVPDVSPEVMSELLGYVYTAEVEHLTEFNAFQLLRAANRFDVHGLKNLCSEYLSSRVSLGNCFELLIRSGETGDVNLRSYCLRFLQFHSDSIMQHKRWEEFLKCHALLAIEVMIPRSN